MNYNVHFSKPAKLDINHTVNYIDCTLKNPTAADRLLDKIQTGIASLSTMPQRCAKIDEPGLSAWEIRYLIIEKYFAFFQIDEDRKAVYVLRFLCEKSDWKNILKHNSIKDVK